MVQTVVPKYYNYYSWIIPCKGEKGPSIAFRIHLNEENAEAELRGYIQGISEGRVPQIWRV